MYDYAIEFFGVDGRAVYRVPVHPDWQPALEYARFADVRLGVAPAEAAPATGAIEPRWHPETGAPYLDGVSAIAAGPNHVRHHVPRSYFGSLVRTSSAALVKEGVVERADDLRFLVRAEPRTTDAVAATSGTDFTIEEITQPLPITDASLDGFLDEAALHDGGTNADDAGDIRVFLPADSLAEGQARARAAGDVETGGILLGRLHRDRAGGDVFLEVTAQVPAEHTVPNATKLTFTPETWTAARAAVARRGKGEVWCGWWHSHPDFCRSCTPESRARCTMRTAFLSAEDLHLHRTCFPQAYTIALLFSDTPAGFTTSLFGWRRGTIEARDYHLSGASTRAPTPPTKGASDAPQTT